MTTKTPNWTDAEVATLKQAYSENQNLTELSKTFGKTVPALRSKLVYLGVYEKQQATKAGASAVRKVTLVGQLAKRLGVDAEAVQSLEKANKEALELLLKAVPEVAE
jgi:hypothetical protein